jgi:Protein of unknown function (DUF2442)
MEGMQSMSASESSRSIVTAKATPPETLALKWSDGTRAQIGIGRLFRERAFRSLRDPKVFERAKVGDWGHSIAWPSGAELGADTLWLETLSSMGRQDTREFLEWRLRHGLSLTGAAEALGVSRRMVAYYSNGEKPVPKPILLACKGWESSNAA